MPQESKTRISTDFALIVQQEGKAQTTLAKFLKLLLSYKYGLHAELVTNFTAVTGILRRSGEHLRCVCVIQNQMVNTRSTIPVLGDKGRLPLFLILPGHVAQKQRDASGGLDNLHYVHWEMALTNEEGSLQDVISTGLATEEMFAPGEDFEDRMRERLEQLDTLPTLPSIVMHIMRLVSDPKTTMAQLEELLSSDPAIVLKVMQVANSPWFAGTARHGKRWTLPEAIVRLGLRKVGAIAQQIALINSFVRPEDSEFDMQRFWEHSVTCALVANTLVDDQYVTMVEEVEFNDYWLACLLHDCGMLVQGFFFWEWFERILRSTDATTSFHEAEEEMGGLVTHEFIGELLMQKSNMPNEIVEAVGLHHMPGESPGQLVALVHVANGLAKDLGLGYTESESADYARPALDALKLTRQGVRGVKDALQDTVVGQVRALVKQCMS